jgi:hypothetical protein
MGRQDLVNRLGARRSRDRGAGDERRWLRVSPTGRAWALFIRPNGSPAARHLIVENAPSASTREWVMDRRRIAGVVAALGVVLSGCAAGSTSLPGASSAPASPSPFVPQPPPVKTASATRPAAAVATPVVRPADSPAIATAVLVTCGPGAPILGSNSVGVASVGVRFVVTGTVGWALGISSDRGDESILLERSPMVIATTSVLPGDAVVSCSDPSLPATAPGTALRIEDPAGLYRPIAPGSSAGACMSGNLSYGPNAKGKHGDPVALTRAVVSGIKPQDVVERGGYPAERGSVRIVRAGEVIGSLGFDSDGAGGWLLIDSTLCDGLGTVPG